MKLRAFCDAIVYTVVLILAAVAIRVAGAWLEDNLTLDQLHTIGTVCLLGFAVYMFYTFRLSQLETQETLKKFSNTL
jgi:uncharacterized membrane protein YfcA